MSMKRHLSVMMLASRSTIYKVLALLIVMALAQTALFYFTLQNTADDIPVGLEELVNRSRIALISAICFLLLCGLLSLTGCESGSKLGYTVRRLLVSEQAVVIWWSVYNAICILLFWIAQLAIALFLCRLYLLRTDATLVSNQTVWLAFYRNNFLHSLLPLAETSRYLRNGIFVLCLAISAAYFSYRQRRGKIGLAMVTLSPLITLNFSKPMGSFASDLFLSIIALSVTIGTLIMREENANEQGF